MAESDPNPRVAPVPDPDVSPQPEPPAPAQNDSEAPLQSDLHASLQANSQAPLQADPQAPLQINPQAPLQQDPQAPLQPDFTAATSLSAVSINGMNGPAPFTSDLSGLDGTAFSDPSLLLATLDPTMMPIPTMPNMMNGFDGVPVEAISADEIALYDRQIRLWGVKAQERLRSASILIVGMKALAGEIAKNLVLAGIGSLTILDHEVVTEEDLGSQFLLSEEHVGQNRAQAASINLRKLNTRVNLTVDTTPVTLKTQTPEYFSLFNVTIATAHDLDTLSAINISCRMANCKFYAADIHGMYGYIFADLISHDFVMERTKANVATPKPGTLETPTRTILSSTTKKESGKVIEMVSKREIYSPLILANSSPLPVDVIRNRRRKLQVSPLLTCLRALFEFRRMVGGRLPSKGNPNDLQIFTSLAGQKHQELLLPAETLRSEVLRAFIQNLGSEISPTAAFLGGSLAQDVINVLGQREQPLQNLLLFDGEECKAPIYSMHSIFEEDASNMAAMSAANGSAVEDLNGMPGPSSAVPAAAAASA